MTRDDVISCATNLLTSRTDLLSSGVSLGVDVGGTKTEIRLDIQGLSRNHHVIPSSSWRRNSDTVTPDDMLSLMGLLHKLLGNLESHATVCIGLHGADTKEQLRLSQDLALQAFPGRSLVVNDAELLGPAAGQPDALNLVVGTGMIVVGRSPEGRLLRSDGYGYGWALSEYGSAPALARESVRTILSEATIHDENAALHDPLGRLFASELNVRSIPDLALAFGSRMSETSWGALAHLVFDALAEESPLADLVVSRAIRHIHAAISSVRSQGARTMTVVAAGGVITHQPEMARRLTTALSRDSAGPMTLTVLRRHPVEGAVLLAKNLHGRQSSSTAPHDDTL